MLDFSSSINSGKDLPQNKLVNDTHKTYYKTKHPLFYLISIKQYLRIKSLQEDFERFVK